MEIEPDEVLAVVDRLSLMAKQEIQILVLQDRLRSAEDTARDLLDQVTDLRQQILVAELGTKKRDENGVTVA